MPFLFCVFFTSVAQGQCESLTVADFSRVTNRSPAAVELQHAVAIAYQDIRDNTRIERLLNDGYIGAATVAQFVRFCTDINLTDSDDLSGRLIDALRAFAVIVSGQQDWRQVTASEAFIIWAATLESGIYGEFFDYRRDGKLDPGAAFLLADYAARESPQPAPNNDEIVDQPPVSGLYVLRKEDFEILKEELAAFGALDTLLGIKSITESGFRAQIATALALDNRQSRALLDQLVKVAERSTIYHLNEQVVDRLTVDIAPKELLDGTAILQKSVFPTEDALTLQITEMLENLAIDDVAKVNLYKSHIEDSIEPVVELAVTANTLADSELRILAETIPETVLKSLEPLQDIQFPDGEIFRTAVRLSAGVEQGNDSAMAPILRVARKSTRPPGQSELQLAPIQWRGGDCGCGVFESLSDEYPRFLYGIYPYWQAPQAGNKTNERDAAVVDFNLLNRVAYYGVTFDADGRMNLPLHFQQKQQPEDGWFWKRHNFAQFVYKAHQYKTKVDLVVYNSKWGSWLPNTQANNAPPAGQNRDSDRAVDELIESISTLVTERLAEPINYMKPFISLGYSPARTMADGVTLHFDFRTLGEAEQQLLFDELLGEEFYKTLRERLRGSDESAKGRIRYFTNLIIPGICLSGEQESTPRCAYFSLDNLQKIVGHVDLFLVDMSMRSPGSNVLSEMSNVRARIESLTADTQIEILRKLVPLAAMPLEDNEETSPSDGFLYADWQFSGFGTWQLVSDQQTKDALHAAFLGVSSNSFLGRIETWICNAACPHRWWLRAAIFVLAVVSAGYAIASYWSFSLRAVFATRSFRWGVPAITAVLIITLWCDPFWSRYRSVILLFPIVVFLGLWLLGGWRKDRQRLYP